MVEPTITKDRLADQVFHVLRDRVVARTLPPGGRLSVPALAAELGISRSPVREAVQRLVSEGLADERPNQGATVVTFDLAGLADMYEVRAPLDGLATELAVRRQGQTLLPQLEKAVELHRQAVAAGDVDQVITADTAFHSVFVDCCGNEQLKAVLDPIHRRVAVAILAGEPLVWPAEALTEHEKIVAAVRASDAELAGRAAAEHILAARGRICGKLTAQEAVPHS